MTNSKRPDKEAKVIGAAAGGALGGAIGAAMGGPFGAVIGAAVVSYIGHTVTEEAAKKGY